MPDIKPGGICPKCQLDMVQCRYNRFHRGELRIDAWEHKCSNCGHRDTIAYRNDDEEGAAILEKPALCPYCGRLPAENVTV